MEKLQNEVYLTLRETENCLAATEVIQPQSESDVSSSKDLRRVLAVVSHMYMEEAENHAVIPQREGWFVCFLGIFHWFQTGSLSHMCSLFVLKYKSQSSSELYPHLLIPIDSNLSVSLSQLEPDFKDAGIRHSGTASFIKSYIFSL